MAKFCANYPLCPLTDQHNLLGVSADSSPGCVIVTLGKNIIIRYKLADQKQISSWSSRNKLSSPVIYDDGGNQYIGIFGKNQLSVWPENVEDLDRLKKKKFHSDIHGILRKAADGPLVVFSNGAFQSLSTVLEPSKARNLKPLLHADDAIEDCALITYRSKQYVTFITRNSMDIRKFHIAPISSKEVVSTFQLQNDNSKLLGYTFVEGDHNCQLLTLWSDGKLFSLEFLPTSDFSPPGTLLSIVEGVSTKHEVAMVSLSLNHLAIYGADTSEEGAALVIFNTQYGVVQSRRHFKVFTAPPRIWHTWSCLLVATARHLVVVPYKLEAQQLSAMIGAQCVASTADIAPDVQEQVLHAKWVLSDSNDTNVNGSKEDDIPESLKSQLKSLEADGCPQSIILEKIIPSLVEAKDGSALLWCLNSFSDIPESCLMQLLSFSLEENSSNNPSACQELLAAVLKRPFSDVCLIPHLRAWPFHVSLKLLHYLADELESEETKMELGKLMDWMCVLLDAHYQRYLLSSDPDILELLQRLSSCINTQVSNIQELQDLLPILQEYQKGKLGTRKPQYSSKFYSIELLQLY